MRTIDTLDKQIIKIQRLKGYNHFFDMSNLCFNRSFERVESFTSSSEPTHNYLAILTNRRVQVYDYILNKLLLSVKVPNSLTYNKSRNLHFLDNDNILML